MRTIAAWISTALLLSLTNIAHAVLINPTVQNSVDSSGVSFLTNVQISKFFETRALVEFDISAQSTTASHVSVDFLIAASDISADKTIFADFRAGDGGTPDANDFLIDGSTDDSFLAVSSLVMTTGQMVSLDVTAAYNSIAPNANYFSALFLADSFRFDDAFATFFLEDISLTIDDSPAPPPPPPPGGGGNPVPEPSIIALFGAGLLGLGFAQRRRRRS